MIKITTLKQTQFYADSEAFLPPLLREWRAVNHPVYTLILLEAVAMAVDVPSFFTREVRRGTDFVDCSLKMRITIHFTAEGEKQLKRKRNEPTKQ